LNWGRELADGWVPGYETVAASPPHPLSVAAAALAAPLGTDGAFDAIRAVVLLSYGATAWIAFRLGEEAFSWPAGVVAGLAVALNPTLGREAAGGFQDVPFVALALGALLLEVQRPRRGASVLALIGIAGLLRPEAWLLGGAYWLYLFPALGRGERLRTAGLVALPAVLWVLGDLLVTGDPLHSSHSAGRAAVEAGFPHGLADVPDVAINAAGDYLSKPEFVAGLAGLCLGLALHRRAAVLLSACMALVAVAFVGAGVSELPLVERFLLLPAVGAIVFAGLAATGWLGRPPGPARRLWAAGALVLLAAAVVVTPSQLDDLRSYRAVLSKRARVMRELRGLTRAHEAAFDECPEVWAANFGMKSLLAYYADEPGEQVRLAERERPRRGVVVLPATSASAREVQLGLASRRAIERSLRPGFRRLGENGSWELYARGCGGATEPRR
jgi:hypothetical protein